MGQKAGQTSGQTPGPWEACLDSVMSVRKDRRTTTLIAECRISERRKEEAQANAHLIAAAPDLLAALKHLLKRPYNQDAADQARAAIAKAKGE